AGQGWRRQPQPGERNDPAALRLRLGDQSAGARDQMLGDRLGGPGKRPRRRHIGSRVRIARQTLGDPVALIGIEPPIGKSGEVEKTLALVLDRLGRSGAAPQCAVRGFGGRLTAGSLTSIIDCSGHAYSTMLPAKLSPQPTVSQMLNHRFENALEA